MADGRAGVRDLVIAGDVGGVRAWLDAGGDPDQTDPATNQTLLVAAAFEGRLEVVRLLLGRGPDFAWSATSGESDLIDVRAEELCNKDGSAATADSTAYMYNGTCTDMYTRTDTWFAKPSAGASRWNEARARRLESVIPKPVDRSAIETAVKNANSASAATATT